MSPHTHTPNRLRVEAALRQFLASGPIEVGARLPPFPDLARRFDTSVAVLQAVVPRLVEERILEVVPRVGTFLRRRFEQAVPIQTGNGIRFQVAESAEWPSPAWRKLINAFEAAHPGLRVELALADPGPDPILRRPDILLTNVADAFRRIRGGGYRAWADESVWLPDERVPYVRDMWQRTGERRMLPILFGFQTLFLAPDLVTRGFAVPGTMAELVAQLPRLPGRLGLVTYDPFDALILTGFGSGRMDAVAAGAWLRLVATCPAPALVLPTDISAADDASQTSMRMLVEGRPLAMLGQLWMARSEVAGWVTLPPPGGHPIGVGAMFLLLPEGTTQTAAAEQFARFIAGPDGQAILADDHLLPTYLPATATHRHAGLLADQMRRGDCQLTNPLHDFSSGHEARRLLNDLRVGRTTVDEVLRRLIELDR